jgi:tetrahydromethanopterin S-methyltransferase subunit G
MQLTEQEAKKVHGILSDFKKIHDDLHEIETQLSALSHQKDVVLKRLNEIRERDTELHAELTMRFGPGKIDPSTMKWINR